MVLSFLLAMLANVATAAVDYDVVVYGSSPAGIAAATAAGTLGMKVCSWRRIHRLPPSHHIFKFLYSFDSSDLRARPLHKQVALYEPLKMIGGMGAAGNLALNDGGMAAERTGLAYNFSMRNAQ